MKKGGKLQNDVGDIDVLKSVMRFLLVTLTRLLGDAWGKGDIPSCSGEDNERKNMFDPKVLTDLFTAVEALFGSLDADTQALAALKNGVDTTQAKLDNASAAHSSGLNVVASDTSAVKTALLSIASAVTDAAQSL